jgi:hypothetical protein
MSLTNLLHRRAPRASARARGSWSEKWAAFILDRRETAMRPMAFDWLSI